MSDDSRTEVEPDADWFPGASDAEKAARQRLSTLLAETPIPVDLLPEHLPLFLRSQLISDIMTIGYFYRQISEVPGIVIEFGVGYGRRLAVMQACQQLYEPFNHQRRLLGFDTFEGFPDPGPEDGNAEIVHAGSFSVPAGYEEYLRRVLECLRSTMPMAHMEMIRIFKGDAPEELTRFLALHPETSVAFAYFDMDLYRPTRLCLEALRPHLVAGSILAFDEFAHPEFPGETQAVREFISDTGIALRKPEALAHPAYLVWPG